MKAVASPVWNFIKIAGELSQGEFHKAGIAVSTEKPVNKDLSLATRREVRESNSSQSVQIQIDDNTGGRTRVSGQLSPIPVTVNSTRKF